MLLETGEQFARLDSPRQGSKPNHPQWHFPAITAACVAVDKPMFFLRKCNYGYDNSMLIYDEQQVKQSCHVSGVSWELNLLEFWKNIQGWKLKGHLQHRNNWHLFLSYWQLAICPSSKAQHGLNNSSQAQWLLVWALAPRQWHHPGRSLLYALLFVL